MAGTPNRRTLLKGALGVAGVAGLSRFATSAQATVSSVTKYGINVATATNYNTRIATYGRVNVARVYYTGMVPAAWKVTKEGLSEAKRVQVSFKSDPAAFAAGTYDAQLISWLVSIPEGWTVWLTFWHEPNDELKARQFTADSYRAAWSHLSLVARSQTPALSLGTRVLLAPVFMGYQANTATGWSDAWVPSPAEVDVLCWDCYGNPGKGGARGVYPTVNGKVDPCLRVTERLGFTEWGISEFNAPKLDYDPAETERVKWLEGFRSHCQDPARATAPQLGPPSIMLLWETKTAFPDQGFYTEATKSGWRNVITASP
ncbi:MAG: hypothetical protein ACR2JT_06145 [Nocardioidaceae bacterium]